MDSPERNFGRINIASPSNILQVVLVWSVCVYRLHDIVLYVRVEKTASAALDKQTSVQVPTDTNQRNQ